VSVRGVEREVEGDVEEGEGRSVVTARLGGEQVSKMSGNMLVGELSSNDRLGENLARSGG
jgi:hypothetical protein